MKPDHFENILGYNVTTQSVAGLILEIYSCIKERQKVKFIVCANPHSLMIAEKDLFFKESLMNADVIVPDGSGMVLASKILGGSIKERITGSGVFRGLSKKLNEEGGYSYFFLGSSEENLTMLKDKVQKDFPNIDVAGTFSPPYKPDFNQDEINEMIDAVNRTEPDVLWVGMTAPKQEKWVYQNREKLNVKFIGPVGAVFDFYIGKVERSHPWFLKHGLEWLPRLFQEPRRLYERTLISAPKFLLRVLKQRFNNDHEK